jgi:hypothetical protein
MVVLLKEMLEEESPGHYDSERWLNVKDTTDVVNFIVDPLKNQSMEKVGKNMGLSVRAPFGQELYPYSGPKTGVRSSVRPPSILDLFSILSGYEPKTIQIKLHCVNINSTHMV